MIEWNDSYAKRRTRVKVNSVGYAHVRYCRGAVMSIMLPVDTEVEPEYYAVRYRSGRKWSDTEVDVIIMLPTWFG